MYNGDIRLGDTIDIKFTTRRFTTGAPFTLAGSPVISAYVGNGTTEITAGITLTVDFDARTGLNNVRVVASSGNGFATATNVQLVITTGTVDSVSVVGEIVGTFSIEARSALMPTTAARTIVVDAAGLADANVVKVGPTGSGTAQTAGDIMADTNDIQTRLPAALVGGRMDASVGAMAANVLTAAAINADAITDAKVAADVTIASVTGAVGSVAGLTAATVHADLDDIQARLPAALTVDGNIKADALRVGGTIQTAGDLSAQIDAVDNFVDTEVGAIKTVVDAIQVKTDGLPSDPADASVIAGRFDTLDTSVADLPTNAELATAFASGDDAVLAAIAALNNLSQANIRTAIGLATANLDTQLDALPTNGELATALASADDATLAAVAALNNLSSAQVQTAAAAALTAYDPPTRTEATSDKDEVIVQINANETKIDTVDTVVDAIKAKTDSLTFTVAGQTDANIQSVNDITVNGDGQSGTEWGP